MHAARRGAVVQISTTNGGLSGGVKRRSLGGEVRAGYAGLLGNSGKKKKLFSKAFFCPQTEEHGMA